MIRKLVWFCRACNHLEDVGCDDEGPMAEIGEQDNCVHCPSGVAIVIEIEALSPPDKTAN